MNRMQKSEKKTFNVFLQVHFINNIFSMKHQDTIQCLVWSLHWRWIWFIDDLLPCFTNPTNHKLVNLVGSQITEWIKHKHNRGINFHQFFIIVEKGLQNFYFLFSLHWKFFLSFSLHKNLNKHLHLLNVFSLYKAV